VLVFTTAMSCVPPPLPLLLPADAIGLGFALWLAEERVEDELRDMMALVPICCLSCVGELVADGGCEWPVVLPSSDPLLIGGDRDEDRDASAWRTVSALGVSAE
jgi:hypothetical protein